MLFARDELPNVLGFVSRFYTSLNVPSVDIDVDAVTSVLEHTHDHMSGQPGGVCAASPFKKAASFLCYFVQAGPIKTPFPPESALGSALASVTGNQPVQNAVIALRIAMESLHGAELLRTDGEVCEVSRRLDLSRHSYIDIVDALMDATPDTYKYVAVLLEQMTYKTNPRCQYPSYQVSGYVSPECRLESVIGHDELMDVWSGRSRLTVEKEPSQRIEPNDVVAGVEDARSSGRLDEVRRGRFHFRQSRRDPELIDRVAADGSVTTGKVVDGLFVEETASDSS